MAAAHLPSITSMTGVRMTAVHLPPMHARAIVEADARMLGESAYHPWGKCKYEATHEMYKCRCGGYNSTIS